MFAGRDLLGALGEVLLDAEEVVAVLELAVVGVPSETMTPEAPVSSTSISAVSAYDLL